MSSKVISTRRLDLVPASIETTVAALAGAHVLGSVLSARVPATWPPDYLDAAAFEFLLARLREKPEHAEWWNYYVVLGGRGGEPATLIGTVGYKGPPDAEGTVEIGYGIVSDHRRRGFATEAALALIDRAFSFPEVNRIVAETLPELAPSIGVMTKCGLRYAGAGSEAGTIRYRLDRPAGGHRA